MKPKSFRNTAKYQKLWDGSINPPSTPFLPVKMLLESNYIQINTLVQEGKEYNILIFNPHVNALFIYPDKDECSEVQYINFGMSVSTVIDLKIA